MKKTILAALMLLLCAGCSSSNKFGACVGVVDQKDPKLLYELSAWNIAMGVIFSETVVVPAVVVAKQLECPKGYNDAPGKKGN